jgi:hypothetical protein
MSNYRRVATACFAAGAVAALAGSFLPWALVPVRGRDGKTRIEARTALHGDGALSAAAAAAGLTLALFCLFRPARKAQLFGMVCFAGAVTFISGLVLSRFPPAWDPGLGLYLTLGGGVEMAVSTVFFTWALQRAPPDVSEGPLPILRE